MNIRTVDGLILTLELMRRYQEETGKNSRKMAAEWEAIIDKFIDDWENGGINGSVPLFSGK
jgi:hypothetical protein